MCKFYREFALKKVLECGNAKAWDKIKIGQNVYLTNGLDEKKFNDLSKQVGVSVNEKGEEIIGVIPEDEGKLIRDFLDMGWGKNNILFSAKISQNDCTKFLENRFKVAVYINQFDIDKVKEIIGAKES